MQSARSPASRLQRLAFTAFHLMRAASAYRDATPPRRSLDFYFPTRLPSGEVATVSDFLRLLVRVRAAAAEAAWHARGTPFEEAARRVAAELEAAAAEVHRLVEENWDCLRRVIALSEYLEAECGGGACGWVELDEALTRCREVEAALEERVRRVAGRALR